MDGKERDFLQLLRIIAALDGHFMSSKQTMFYDCHMVLDNTGDIFKIKQDFSVLKKGEGRINRFAMDGIIPNWIFTAHLN